MSHPPLRDLRLARAVVDRAAVRRSDPAWLAAAWESPAVQVVQVHDGRVAVRGERLVLDIRPEVGPEHRLFLGVAGAIPFFAAIMQEGTGSADAAEAERVSFASIRAVGGVLDDLEAGLVVHAVSLANWHATHTHCPRCGDRSVPEAGGHVRRCVRDGSEHYPRTDPAVIMAVVDADDRLLLGRQVSWDPGRFSTLAGFVEPGESLEAAVRREVAEEVGVDVGDVAYLGSQPWPFPSSLMLGFRAAALTTEIVRHDGEIAEARWLTRADLPRAVAAGELVFPPSISIARRLIEHWYGSELPRRAGG